MGNLYYLCCTVGSIRKIKSNLAFYPIGGLALLGVMPTPLTQRHSLHFSYQVFVFSHQRKNRNIVEFSPPRFNQGEALHTFCCHEIQKTLPIVTNKGEG